MNFLKHDRRRLCGLCRSTVPIRIATMTAQRSWRSVLLTILSIILLLGTRSVAQPTTGAATQQPMGVSVHAGGTGRYGANRWGMMKANLYNGTSVPQTTLMVVTPPGGEGLQYARKISVPAGTAFETAWPVRVDAVPTGSQEFQYLVFPGGEEDGVIHQKQFQDLVPTVSGIVEGSPLGLTGWIHSDNESPDSMHKTGSLLRAMRFDQGRGVAVVSVIPQEITGQGECLEPLDQLAISSSDVVHDRLACESIRLWLQRGGRLLLFLDKTGPELAEVLLGDALSMTIVGEASSNEVLLDLNPEYRVDQYPVRSVRREFDEPVRWKRILHDAGEVIWSVDGWPVAIHVPVGGGTAVVTTISPAVFLERRDKPAFDSAEFSLIASSRPMTSALFTPRTPPLISEASVAKQAAAVVGYQIPSQAMAAILTMFFPLVLLTVGTLLLRRQAGQRLVWILPVLAVVSALPSVVFGMRTRAVAPETVIETQLIRSVPGQMTLVADGYASFYSPHPSVLQVHLEQGTLLENRADATNRDYRRQVWTGAMTSHWENLKQPTGLKTFPVRSLQKLSSGIRAVATFDENGLKGSLLSQDFKATSDLILAGTSSDCMTLTVGSDGTFRGTTDDVLASGQYFSGALLIDQQLQRSAILDSVFSVKDRLQAFPQTASILFWETPASSTLQISGPNVRHMHSVLVVQPLQLEPPEAGRLITIPSPLVPYRAIADADGGFTGVYNNSRREWSQLEVSGVTLLRFELPQVCVPFDPESVQASLLIRAGSRTVTLAAGYPKHLTAVAELVSPLGAHQITIPTAIVKESCRAGHVFLHIGVGDLDESLKSDDLSTGEQDDSWRIERIRLTLTGRRIAEPVPSATAPDAGPAN